MSYQNKKTLWQIQKELKPKAEDVTKELKDKDDYENLIKFLDFLKDNKLVPRWQSLNKWSVRYRNKLICHLGINCHFSVCGHEEGWRASNNQFILKLLITDQNKYMTDDKSKEFIWENMKTPPCACNVNCKGIQNITVLGKQFDAICKCWPFSIKNPNEDQLVY